MPALSKIGALRLVNYPAWKKEIQEAMKKAGGRVPDAARALEISPRQLFRWLVELPQIPRIENGVHRDGTRGRKSVKEQPKAIRRRVKKVSNA